MRSTPKTLFNAGLSLLLAGGLPASLHASGFQTSYHSVASFSRGLGGAGVSHDDLADMYYNPAGLSLYEPGTIQFSVGYGSFSNEFENNGSTNSFPAPGPSTGDEDGIDENIPNISFQWIPEKFLQSDDMQFGVFVGNAFGNQTEYDDDWIGRYHAIKSSLRVLDVSPTISYSINDQTRVGVALSVQFSDAELSNALIVPTMADGKATVTGDDTAFGLAFGLVHRLPNATLGVSYRSKVSHTLDGKLEIEGTPTSDGKFDAEADLDLPETVYLSASFDLPQYPKWNLYWTSRWTRWSRNEELKVEVEDPIGDSITPQEWDDVWLHGIGVSYQYTDNTKFRFGITVDETPIPNEELRTPRQPENDRTWISFGLSHDFRDGGVLDVGINHQMIDDGEIDNTDTILTSPFTVTDTLKGDFEDGDFTLLGVQYRKKF